MRKATLAAFILLSCFLFACTISDGGVPRPYTRSIGPNGGTIADPAGATLIIPAGALAENTRITVTTYQDTLDFGTAYPVLAGALFGVKLEPEGLEFAAPVTLQIAPTATLTAGDEYPAFWYDAAADQWVQTGHATVAAGGAYVETTITHFSDYSIFDMPYDVLDDFDEFVETDGQYYDEGLWGEWYGEVVIYERESFVGPNQYYNGCCYMRSGATMTIQYTYQGRPHTGYYSEGVTADVDSYTLSYSYAEGDLSYSIQLTVYLSCSQGETNVSIGSYPHTLEVGERSEVYGIYLCGEGQTPIAGRIFTFSLDGPGRLSRTTAVTDEEGEARIEYIATAEGTAVITAVMEGCLCNAQLDLNPLVTTIVVGTPSEQWTGQLTATSYMKFVDYQTDYSDNHASYDFSPGQYDVWTFNGTYTLDFTLDRIDVDSYGFAAWGTGQLTQTGSFIYHDYTISLTEVEHWSEYPNTFITVTSRTCTLLSAQTPTLTGLEVYIHSDPLDATRAIVQVSRPSGTPTEDNFLYRFTHRFSGTTHAETILWGQAPFVSDRSNTTESDTDCRSFEFEFALDGASLEEGTFLIIPDSAGSFIPNDFRITGPYETQWAKLVITESGNLVLARLAVE